ncbi:hypothetical protein G4B84_000509 [Aspergillus flavus NRRL3357]|nr:uncharacterized protein G4B84_000509 [Aspergillus flavus NRRL3357]QMW25264.1 hypothetical protein G4B84_000509 [Aspergillus flavus NRRL3357]
MPLALEDEPVVYDMAKEAVRKDSPHLSEGDQRKQVATLVSARIMLMVPKLQRGKVLGLVLGYAFWYLAQHPDAQQRIQTELNSQGIDMRSRETVTNSSKRPRAVELDSLPYLRAVIDECLRMRPTSTPLPRITPPNRKVSVAGIDGIPPGTRINTFQWFVHRDPQKWDNAHDWNPDRWLTRGNTDNKNEREDVLWAFASGLRMCLGNNWTYYAMQHILATICSSFNFTALPREENQCWPGSPEDELPIRTATSQQLVVPLDTRPEEFSKILTRPSLRAEAIGLVLSMAGNAAICLLELDILPLDISDESLLTPGLTPEGYSRQESSPSDWFRARYIFATLREEILSIRLGPMNACNEALIRRISTRIQKAWEGLPSRLCYDPNCTNFSMPYHYLARLLLYLEYLDLNLCTQQVLFDILGKEDDTELLKAAMMLMATTANSMRRFSRKFGASKDTATILWNYSLPSAIVLANALRKCAELGKDMSTPLSWADLYRQLNVLAADLETSSDPTDSNYSLYNERRHSFSKQLDHALNARLERPPLKTRPGASISSNLPMDHMDIFTDIGGDEFTDTLIDIGPMDVVE